MLRPMISGNDICIVKSNNRGFVSVVASGRVVVSRTMSERDQVDLTYYSFEEFVSFLFAREVEDRTENAGNETHHHWYWYG
jgi:hypothetical protein